MSQNNLFVTGPPRSGKSTLVSEVVKEMSIEAEGISTPDIRKNGKRVGFKLKDIKTGEEGVLAHVDQKEGPRVSRCDILPHSRAVGLPDWKSKVYNSSVLSA